MEISVSILNSLDRIKELLEIAGLKFVASYDAFTRNPVNEESERIYIIARECGKSKGEN